PPSPLPRPHPPSRATPPPATAHVRPYVKGPLDAVYSLAAPADTSGAASGSFSYAAAGQGTYSFYTVATDKAGNAESLPGSADVQIAKLTAAPQPPSASVSPRRRQNQD